MGFKKDLWITNLTSPHVMWVGKGKCDVFVITIQAKT